MTLGAIIDHLIAEHNRWNRNQNIYKPFSKALYETWKWCDRLEKARGEAQKED